MINSIEIKNFKCFSHLRFALGRLTLLTGFNAGGKSSAIQPLLLLSQGLRKSLESQSFDLNGELVRLGTASEILPSDAVSPFIDISVVGDTDSRSWTLEARALDRTLRRPDAKNAHEKVVATDLTAVAATAGVAMDISQLTFISAVREGADDTFPYPDSFDSGVPRVGDCGQFAPFIFGERADDVVLPARMHAGEKGATVRKQLDAWLGTLFPQAQANVQLLPHVSLANLQFRTSDIGAWRRPVNVGYGLTYAFPILVALLTATDGQIVIVDSPEAHLHPSAQSRMGQLLVHFANAGIQIIVETHSDHVLNGVRIAAREGVMSARDVCIHFFTGARGAEHGVVSPHLDSSGALSEWPTGFFDQSDRDLSILAGWT